MQGNAALHTDGGNLDPLAIRTALLAVLDPEIGVNIVDLGLIHKIEQHGSALRIELIMTTPACPMGAYLVREVEQTLRKTFPAIAQLAVQLNKNVLWKPDRMSAAGRRQLGMP